MQASRNGCGWRNILFRLVLSTGIFGYTTESHKRASPTNVLQRRTYTLAQAVDALGSAEQWAVAAVAAAAAAGTLPCGPGVSAATGAQRAGAEKTGAGPRDRAISILPGLTSAHAAAAAAAAAAGTPRARAAAGGAVDRGSAGGLPSPPFEDAFLPGSPWVAAPGDADAEAAAAAEAVAATAAAAAATESGAVDGPSGGVLSPVVAVRVPEPSLADYAAEEDYDGAPASGGAAAVAAVRSPLALAVPDEDDEASVLAAPGADAAAGAMDGEPAAHLADIEAGLPSSSSSSSIGDDAASMSTVIARPRAAAPESLGLLSRFSICKRSSKPDMVADAESPQKPAAGHAKSLAPPSTAGSAAAARDFTPLGPLLRVPPVLLLNAENDLQLDLDAGKMARVLRRSGVPVDRIVFPGLAHDTIVSVFERNQARPVFLRFLQGVFTAGAASAAAE